MFWLLYWMTVFMQILIFNILKLELKKRFTQNSGNKNCSHYSLAFHVKQFALYTLLLAFAVLHDVLIPVYLTVCCITRKTREWSRRQCITNHQAAWLSGSKHPDGYQNAFPLSQNTNHISNACYRNYIKNYYGSVCQ